MPLSSFHPLVADWFGRRFGSPTNVQTLAWSAIASGADTLIAAPTGSGKTLAAFLSCLDQLFRQALARELDDRTQVLYVSPLKALSNDVQKNLQQPLGEISEAALAAGLLIPDIRVTVRTGDTPVKERQQMLRRPPHILVTTPESLFLLLTAEKSRHMLRDVRTVIVDEIHALAPNKRGAHLALSLERLDALTGTRPVRIGLSATQRPMEVIAQFLVGQGEDHTARPCRILDVGHRRPMDLAVEVPKDELSGVATNAIWSDVYDRLADLVRQHRSTLVFVNTRRLVERVSHRLAERLEPELGTEAVAAHHGSLSKETRLSAETRLKGGTTRVVVATASLELGIDVGTVDLVCQLGSPRSIAVGLQRIGRSGHWVGAVPKGRLFATTRDEVVECAAIVRAIRAGTLDAITIPSAPLDILAQQIVAAAATQPWEEEDLFALCRRAYSYRDLSRSAFDDVLRMLADGIATSRGRGRAYVHHDRIHHRIRARRGARLAALTSGGAIPDTAGYTVVAEPDGTVVGTVDEDFAVESLAGDIMLLGNTSWRIRGVELGKVRVEDAQGAPPTIPFWRGEAPSRTAELSAEVAALRVEVDRRLPAETGAADEVLFTHHASLIIWLKNDCGLDQRGAEQVVAYLLAGRALLGAMPTQSTIIAERFFDEGGGMQLVIHAPFGGRLTRAWGLALRKRFCQSFDFELQAAATDDGLVLSLGEKHSFPLDTIFLFLHQDTVRETLIQAVLQAPMFISRWRWNASRALALLRFTNGKKVPPQIQRMRAEDLLGAVFPDATACQDNHMGPRTVPDHPLVQETLRDCLTEAMDVEGLEALLRRMAAGDIRCLAVETPMPSVFSHEILNANPYAFLDDAPLEERRARAVELRRTLPPELLGQLGTLSPEAIDEVGREAWPVVRDADELHDALLTLVWVPEAQPTVRRQGWATWIPALMEDGRAVRVVLTGVEPVIGWAATERRSTIRVAFPTAEIHPHDVMSDETVSPVIESEDAVRVIVQGWMENTGPTTAVELSASLSLDAAAVRGALLALEASGQVLRGRFRGRLSPGETQSSTQEEWCDRRLLARIHRLTIGQLRREIEPVTAAEFMRFLVQWQHVAPQSRLHGEAGLMEVIRQLTGFEAPASAWEQGLLRARLAKYDPQLLDRLCLSGAVAWGRLSPPVALTAAADLRVAPIDLSVVAAEGRGRTRRIMPTSVAPISIFPREETNWLLAAVAAPSLDPLGNILSAVAQDVQAALRERGASFFTDLVQATRHVPAQVEDGLWELVAAGLVTSDGFDNLRSLIDPHRRRAEGRERNRRPRHGTGRWSLLRSGSPIATGATGASGSSEQVARALLRRYGVVFRDLLARESLVTAWRDLLVHYRRLELQGEVRGGRFVSGFTGEQFALPEAVEALRALRRSSQDGASATAGPEIRLSAADPLNLIGIILPGPRVPSTASNYIILRNGLPVRSGAEGGVASLSGVSVARRTQQPGG